MFAQFVSRSFRCEKLIVLSETGPFCRLGHQLGAYVSFVSRSLLGGTAASALPLKLVRHVWSFCAISVVHLCIEIPSVHFVGSRDLPKCLHGLSVLEDLKYSLHAAVNFKLTLKCFERLTL